MPVLSFADVTEWVAPMDSAYLCEEYITGKHTHKQNLCSWIEGQLMLLAIMNDGFTENIKHANNKEVVHLGTRYHQ